MQTFKKEERLTNKIIIRKLFSEGRSFRIFPLKVTFLFTTLSSRYPVQVLIAANKRHIRGSVKRNKAKRLIREVYRKNKEMLYDYYSEQGKQCALAITYNHKELVSFRELETIIIIILQRLMKENEKALE